VGTIDTTRPLMSTSYLQQDAHRAAVSHQLVVTATSHAATWLDYRRCAPGTPRCAFSSSSNWLIF